MSKEGKLESYEVQESDRQLSVEFEQDSDTSSGANALRKLKSVKLQEVLRRYLDLVIIPKLGEGEDGSEAIQQETEEGTPCSLLVRCISLPTLTPD
jgi:hypothetical protein